MIEPRVSMLDERLDPRPVVRTDPVRAEVDLEALTEWLLAGLTLFVREGLPSRQAVDDAALRVVLAAALRRTGSISGAAAALGTSRRSLRDAMKRLGIYDQWRDRGRSTARAGASGVDDVGGDGG